MRLPAAQNKRQRAVRQDPLTVIFTRNMEVRAGRQPSLAGGVSNGIVQVKSRPGWNTLICANMQEEQDPARLFNPISVQIQNNHTIFRADNQARRRRYNPFLRGNAAGFGAARRKIKRSSGRVGTPGCMRSTGEAPNPIIVKRQIKDGLGQVGWKEGFKGLGAQPGITEQLFIHTWKTICSIQHAGPFAQY